MNTHGFILPSRIIGILILLVALLPAGLGVFFYNRTSSLVTRAATTQGTVVALESSGGTTYHSVFEYRDASGTTHQTVSSWSSNPPAHSVGQTVQLLYDPANPSDAKPNTFLSLWLGPLICAGMTIVPLTMSLIFLWLIPFTIRRVWPDRSKAR